MKKREVKTGKEQKHRSEKQVSEDRRGDRERRTYIGISRKKERGRGEKSRSTDLSNMSMKTDGDTRSREPKKGCFERKSGDESKRARAEISLTGL